jgi:hypothetical protein
MRRARLQQLRIRVQESLWWRSFHECLFDLVCVDGLGGLGYGHSVRSPPDKMAM